MIDAILYAVRDAIRGAQYGYDHKTCEVMADGHPPPRCGDWFAAVHQGASTSDSDNCLMEYFAFALTLTARVVISLDRVGDRLLAKQLARETGFNARAEQLRAFLHMNWGVLQDANNNLFAWSKATTQVNGFCEPARYRGMDVPVLVGGEWFNAEPDAMDVGLKAELRFEDARRLQPIATYS